jgi:hypothetical protein
MKALNEMTDAELRAEWDAATYFYNASDDEDTILKAARRVDDCEAEMDRRSGVNGGEKHG